MKCCSITSAQIDSGWTDMMISFYFLIVNSLYVVRIRLLRKKNFSENYESGEELKFLSFRGILYEFIHKKVFKF